MDDDIFIYWGGLDDKFTDKDNNTQDDDDADIDN